MARKPKPYIDGATWINNGKEEKIVAGDEVDTHCSNGWWIGMLGTDKPEVLIHGKPAPKKPGRPKKKAPEMSSDEPADDFS